MQTLNSASIIPIRLHFKTKCTRTGFCVIVTHFQNRQEHDQGADARAGAGVRLRDPRGVRLRPRNLRPGPRLRRQAAPDQAAPLRGHQHARGGADLIMNVRSLVFYS